MCIFFLHGKGKGLEWFVKFLYLKKVSETSVFSVCTILLLVVQPLEFQCTNWQLLWIRMSMYRRQIHQEKSGSIEESVWVRGSRQNLKVNN